MDKKVEVSIDDLMRVCNILDSLRVSLDRIGAMNSQGRDKMLQAMDDYFTPKVYREIADCWLLLYKLLEKKIGTDELLKKHEEKNIKPFDL